MPNAGGVTGWLAGGLLIAQGVTGGVSWHDLCLFAGRMTARTARSLAGCKPRDSPEIGEERKENQPDGLIK